MAGQQGAYIARVINRNVTLGVGGLDEDPPYKTVEANKAREFDNEFEFLSLGIMAYIGRERAVMQVRVLSLFRMFLGRCQLWLIEFLMTCA